MSPILKTFPHLVALLVVAGCTSIPTGPSVMALPGTGKNFDQFRADDGECRQYSSVQVGGNTPNQAAADSGVKSAIVGTLIGAAAGAAMNGGQGAAVGAGVGLAGGALAGTGAGEQSSYALQHRYDIAYTQCMYAKGHKVPVSGRFESSTPEASGSRTTTPPPPPPGNPPPPPPR
jgi:outer membrane lipoprotein SlyB